MPNATFAFTRFSFGEVTPRLWGDPNTIPYQKGLARCVNMIPDSRGSVYNRPGVIHRATVGNYSNAKLYGGYYVGSVFCFFFVESELKVYGPSGLEHTIPTPYSASDLEWLRFYEQPGDDRIWILCPYHPPHLLRMDTWELVEITFLNPPPEWSDPDSWPSCMTFYQGRAWLSGVKNAPESFWGSKSGVFADFTEGANADDAIYLTIGKRGLIRWIVGTRNLLLGTTRNEFIVSSGGPIITPSDFYVQQQSSIGSSGIDPVNVGVETVFTTVSRQKLFTMSYKWTEQGYFPTDISFTANDLITGRIKAMTYQEEPEPAIWLLTSDNKFLGCSYVQLSQERKDMIVGWHQHHNLALDKYVDVFAIDRYVFIAYTNSNGMHFGMLDMNDTWPYPVDNYNYYPDVNGEVIRDLEHLNGYEVDVVGDGYYQGRYRVKSGQIALDRAVNWAIVGVPFEKYIVTLPIAAASQQGAVAHQLKRMNKICVSCFNSAKPKIGAYPDIERPWTLPESEPPEINKGLETVCVSNVGRDRDHYIVVMQDLPFRLQVLRIAGSVEISSL